MGLACACSVDAWDWEGGIVYEIAAVSEDLRVPPNQHRCGHMVLSVSGLRAVTGGFRKDRPPEEDIGPGSYSLMSNEH